MAGDIWVISEDKIWYSQELINRIIEKCKPYCIDIGDDIYTEGWMGKRELAKQILDILDYKNKGDN